MIKFNNNYSSSLFAGLLALSTFTASAQISVNPTDDNVITKKDAAQHAEWKKGKNQFPGKPRDMWQVGIGGGSFLISGDVKPQFGWGASVHVRKSLGYVFSLKAEYMFGQARGLNYAASSYGAHPNVAPFAITPSGRPDIVITPGDYSTADNFYANYKVEQYHALSLQTVYNLNNIKFHKKRNKWSLNLILGLGANLYKSKINALKENGTTYAADFNAIASGGYDLSKLADRKTVRDEVKGVLDNSYETMAPQNKNNILTFGDEGDKMVMNPFANIGINLEFLLTRNLTLAIEHQVYISSDDFIDGKYRKENGALTSNTDVPHYTSLRLGINLGKKEKTVEPLWFINPLIYPMQDISDLKEKLQPEWFQDTDDDGVPDALDKEPDTPEDIAVDAKGRTLDSDKDGVPDSKDKEPFSPPGYPTDEDGVADVPKPITPADVKIVENGPGKQPTLVIGEEEYEPFAGGGIGGGNWYLPMIHFDLNKYNLRPESYSQLAHVAMVMKNHPEMKVIVHGHTDVRAGEEYNDMLSYNRAMESIDFLVNKYNIERNRLIVRYNGEKVSLITDAKKEDEHFINRRVEFYVAQEGENGQGRPSSDGGTRRKWKH